MYVVFRGWKDEKTICGIGEVAQILGLFYAQEMAIEKAQKSIDELINDVSETWVVDSEFGGWDESRDFHTCILFRDKQDNWGAYVEIRIQWIDPA